jgi:hypothetical protein
MQIILPFIQINRPVMVRQNLNSPQHGASDKCIIKRPDKRDSSAIMRQRCVKPSGEQNTAWLRLGQDSPEEPIS